MKENTINQKRDEKRKNLLIPEYLDSEPIEHAKEMPTLQPNIKKLFEIIGNNPSQEELSQVAASKGAEFIANKLFLLSQGSGNNNSKTLNRSRRGKSENQEMIEKKEKYIKGDFKEMVENKIKALLENKYENNN